MTGDGANEGELVYDDLAADSAQDQERETTMSAFLVSDDCLNTIVNHIIGQHYQPHSRLRTFAGVDLSLPDADQQIADALVAMNMRSLVARYENRHGHADAAPVTVTLKGGMPASRVVTHKAVRCLLYQCTEGQIPEEQTYIDLEQMAQKLAEQIVSDLPEWDAAPWG